MSRAVDIFAGPGGFDEGAREVGIHVVGVELDRWACATREAAGHETVQADVSLLDPAEFAGVDGLIGSPPCPTFSAAGGGSGRALMGVIRACLHDLAAGRDTRAERRSEAYRQLAADGDEKAERNAALSMLCVEPLRWALALEPEWIALEQVPDVLPLWEVTAELLRARGYSVWTGVLSAERYGVPQTRKRAILMASRARRVAPPEPTHQAYVPGEPARGEESLFGTVLPWVSMAEALGWHEADAVGFPRRNDTDSGSEYRERDRRPASEPAFGLTEKVRSWDRVRLRDNTSENAVDVSYDARAQKCGKTGRPNRRRSSAEPAPTIAGESRNDSWVYERPATTVQGDSRQWPPGHKVNAADLAAGRDGYGDRAGTNAIRVTVQEAAVLQGFRPDYPWQGTQTAQFQQVGNAVPPPLAAAVLGVLV